MPGERHSQQDRSDGVHPAVAFTFPTDADRIANINRDPILDPSGNSLQLQVGQLVRQLDTDDVHVVLTAGGSPTYALLTGGSVGPWTEDEFTPTSGQVTFIISTAPADLQTLTFAVNGVLADEGTDYTVSGTTITWLNAPFAMETTDLVVVRYR
jgi:hypothetical protein